MLTVYITISVHPSRSTLYSTAGRIVHHKRVVQSKIKIRDAFKFYLDDLVNLPFKIITPTTEIFSQIRFILNIRRRYFLQIKLSHYHILIYLLRNAIFTVRYLKSAGSIMYIKIIINT